MLNISYYDFMELEDESVARVPADKKIRIVCAKEGSAKYVADILIKHGFTDVGYLAGGIKSWGNLLVPALISTEKEFELYQFIRPGKAACSYGLITAGEMMLFDTTRNVDFYLDFAREKECRIVKVFETHLQADYISGFREIVARTGAEFYANDADFGQSKNKYTSLVDGEIQRFPADGAAVKVIFTPGHTPGSTCYIVNGKYMISGDTVLISSVGRPDLGGQVDEWAAMLYKSIQKIKKFPRDILVLPGHYIDWSDADAHLCFKAPLEAVIEKNSYIYSIDDESRFIEFIKENMRPQPDEYKEIRLVNANLKEVDPAEAEILDLGKNECAATAYAEGKNKG